MKYSMQLLIYFKYKSGNNKDTRKSGKGNNRMKKLTYDGNSLNQLRSLSGKL